MLVYKVSKPYLYISEDYTTAKYEAYLGLYDILVLQITKKNKVDHHVLKIVDQYRESFGKIKLKNIVDKIFKDRRCFSLYNTYNAKLENKEEELLNIMSRIYQTL